MRDARAATVLATLAGLAGCMPGTGPTGRPMPIPPATDPLTVRVVYPPPGAAITARDSTFLFGSVGRGDATLRINGDSVGVWPNGSWLAWLPLPDDTIASFVVMARAGAAAVAESLTYRLGVPRDAPCTGCAWVDRTSFVPSGWLAVPPEEPISLRVRATPGASVRLVVADRGIIPLHPDLGPEEVPWGVRAFARDPGSALQTATRAVHYAATVAARALASPHATLEVAAGGDTVRRAWPLAVALHERRPLAILTDDPHGSGEGDSLTAGLTRPAGTIHWLFPAGTTARVTAWANGMARLDLPPDNAAWVTAADAVVVPEAPPSSAGVVGSLRLVPQHDGMRLLIPISTRAPFHIEEHESALTVRLYGVQADIDWAQYGETDSFVRRLRWDQPSGAEVTVTAELAAPVWGYRVEWQGRTLAVTLRRPPAIDREHPLQGRVILLDPGHPPGGSTGPSGQREAEVTLAVALAARAMLEARGARVLLTRTADAPLSLLARTSLAERSEAEVLVSIHTNALPDGVNPFVNSGTSTYYYHPRSLLLARAINRAIVRAFGTRDLGVGRADLALARPSWLPAVLVEGLFQMLPEHDAWLATDEGKRRYARGIVDGLEAFFRERAAAR